MAFLKILAIATFIMFSGYLTGPADCESVQDVAPYRVVVTPAITSAKILPNDYLFISTGKTKELNVSVCPGEYEPATFIVRARRNLDNLLVTPTDLKSDENMIPANRVDVRVVKCWYQAGTKVYQTKDRLLVPELLLKDDSLIRVDHRKKQNYLRQKGNDVLISGPADIDISEISFVDASTLQPVSISANTNKQFWITIHAADDTAPGIYKGKLKITAEGVRVDEISIEVTVYPFVLEDPEIKYGIYYRGRLSKYNREETRLWLKSKGWAVLNPNWKQSSQYMAELLNLKAHGIIYPTYYQENSIYFQKEIALRREAGLPVDTIYTLGIRTGNPTGADDLSKLQQKITQWTRIAHQYGCNELFFYGIDEAKGDLLLSQRNSWATVRESGGKVFTAISKKESGHMGAYLDTAVLPGPLDDEEAAKYHALGSEVFSYNNPQVGEEDPEVYRRNFGVALWKAGYDGAMNYAYQHGFNHIWNDFDHENFRDHVFAYPTENGVIDTIQFEGFREAVDDIRYLTTLKAYIKRADQSNSSVPAMARKWLDQINPNQNLNLIRKEAAQWIGKLLIVQSPKKSLIHAPDK